MTIKSSHINTFLIGAPKCGTTSLAAYLGEHPKICVSQPKETHFFADDLGAGKGWRVSDELAYTEGFMHKQHASAFLDASTWYLYSKQASVNIHRSNRHAKIIAMIRNPVRMVFSLFEHNVIRGNEPIIDAMEAVRMEGKRRDTGQIPGGSPFFAQIAYTQAANYVEGLRRYRRLFGSDGVMVVVFERFIDDPEQWTKRVLNFLGVADEEFHAEFLPHNASTEWRNLTARRILKRNHIIRSTYGKLPLSVRSAFGKWGASVAGTQPRPQMTHEFRDAMRLAYENSVAELKVFLNDPLLEWEDFV